jgi:ABC-type Na+ efflux pump permease subunit
MLGVLLLIAERQGWWGITAANLPSWVLVIVLIELAVVLLVVTNTAASTLTRERESQTLEMLLSTPLTSKYIMKGMAIGLVHFGIPLICVPALMLLLLSGASAVTGDGIKAVAWLLAALCLSALMVSYAAVAALIGLQFSLSCRKTVQAVMISTGIVLGATALLFGCATLAGNASSHVSAFFAPFSPIFACQAMVTPEVLFGVTKAPTPSEIWEARLTASIASVIATGVYLFLAFLLYGNLVKNFDMTIRRQSAST